VTWTDAVARAAWDSLVNGTALVLATALLLRLFGRRVPAGAQALLWTAALVKFVVPCGPFLFGSLSQALQAVELDLAAAPPAVVIAAAALYASAVAALATRAIRRWRRLVAEARALPPVDAPTRRRLEAAAARLGLRAPDARRSEDVVTPHVAGALRPVLVIPAWLSARRDDEQAFILHELAHLRRLDHLLLPLLAAVEILFFFWPPARWAASRLRGAREAACDATAVATGPLAATAYARALVEAARRLAARPPCPLVLSGAVGCRLEERVDFLLRASRRPGTVWLAAVVSAWMVWALAGGRAAVPQPACGASVVDAW
jgi:beta-lactamase regulating signal transducer with metallopeptidase domain